MDLSVRARKVLQRSGVTNLGELVKKTEGELVAIKNCVKSTLTEMKKQNSAFSAKFSSFWN